MDDQLTKPLRIDELKEVLEATSKIGSTDRLSHPIGSDLPVCDERQLHELLGLDNPEEVVTDILQLFIQQAEQLASRLPELADNPDVLASEAHKLRGAAGYAGAMRVDYFCGIVENAPESSHSQHDHRTVADLKRVSGIPQGGKMAFGTLN